VDSGYSEIEIKHMSLALSLAEKAAGLNHQNPLVGAVVADGETVLGTGYHLFETIEHAEPKAIREAGEKARGASIYVNLEPCSHYGRTPPCVDAIIKSGIRKVYFSIYDTDERVSTNGESALKNAGVEVDCGLLANQATELNRDYLKARATGLPWIVVKAAMSFDGKVGTAGETGLYITCDESLKITHELRAWCGGIMVGAETVRIDNPQLTCRLDSFKHVKADFDDGVLYPVSRQADNPARIVISSNPDFPPNTKLLDTSDTRTIVITSKDAATDSLKQMESHGVEIIRAESVDGEIGLHDPFRELAKMGIMSVMVEGGGILINSLESMRLVDEFYIFIAPVIIGGEDAPSWTSQAIKDIISFEFPTEDIQTFKSGRDILIRARVNPGLIT